MRKLFLILLFAGVYLGTGKAAENFLVSLFPFESDEMIIERLPVEWESQSLGLFEISPAELDQFERPPDLKEFLASHTGLRSFHSSKILAESDVRFSSATLRRDADKLTLQFSGGVLFPAEGDPVLTSTGTKVMTAVCEKLAPYLGRPITLDLWAKDPARAKSGSQNLLSFLADTLSIDPEEIETTFQVTPGEGEEVKIQVLGLAP